MLQTYISRLCEIKIMIFKKYIQVRMVNPINVVKVTTVSLTPSEFQLSGFLSHCFRIIHFIHKIWYWCRRFDLYKNPDNFLKLAAGHTLNWVAGDRALIRIAAQAVLIGTRVIENVKEQSALVKESKNFWRTVTNPYSISMRIKYEEFEPNKWISLKTRYKWKIRIRILTRKIVKISVASFHIIKRLFILSMKTMDAASAFSYGNPHLRQESLNEFFINSSKCMEELIQNREWLVNSLKKNKGVIDTLLKNSFSIFTVDQLINTIEKGLDVTERVHSGIETSSKVVGVFGRDLFKRATFGLFQAAGLTDLMPHRWVPSIDPIWMEEKDIKREMERFPNKELVRRITSFKSVIQVEVDCLFPNKTKQHLGHNLLKASKIVDLRKKYFILE